MKSVTIKHNGVVLIKVIHKKSGEYEVIKDRAVSTVDVEVRSADSKKVIFGKRRV